MGLAADNRAASGLSVTMGSSLAFNPVYVPGLNRSGSVTARCREALAYSARARLIYRALSTEALRLL